jgi:hypothetical protein
MKNITATILTSLLIVTSPTVFAQTTLSPTVNFTLRDDPLNGAADLFDATPDGSGFDGLLTINSEFGEDRHYVEFSMSLLPVSWTSTALTFTTAFIGSDFPPSTLRVSSYSGNGAANLSDWTVATTTLATIPGITKDGGQSFTLDVTSLTAGFGGSGFLGFSFELVDSQLNQKALDASSIILIQVPEPSSTMLGLVGFGVLFVRYRRAFASRHEVS